MALRGRGTELSQKTELGYEEARNFDAVQLFAGRARQANPAFSFEGGLPFIVGLCQMVEGLPLALELAATWTRIMTCEEIVGELEQSLDLLSTPVLNVQNRHKTIRSCFDYSWTKLTDKEQQVYQSLAVFKGGFRREAAQAVAQASLATLVSLVDKSLLRMNEQGRFDFHPLLYQFAQHHLLENTDAYRKICDKHAAYFLGKAKRAGDEENLQSFWTAALYEERANYQAALQRALETNQADLGLKMVNAIARFWNIRDNWEEALNWMNTFVALPESKRFPVEKAKALNNAGLFTSWKNDFGLAETYVNQALEAWQAIGNKREIALAFNTLGIIASRQREVAKAHDFFLKSLNIMQALDDQIGIAWVSSGLANLARMQGDYQEAQRLYNTALAIRREIEDEEGVAHSLQAVGVTFVLMGDFPAAKSYLEESLQVNRTLKSSRDTADVLNALGLTHAYEGNFKKAQACFDESLAYWLDKGELSKQAMVKGSLGTLSVFKGNLDQGRRWLEQSMSIYQKLHNEAAIISSLQAFARLTFEEGGYESAIELWAANDHLQKLKDLPIPPYIRRRREQDCVVAKELLGEKRFNGAWKRGQRLEFSEAVEVALSRSILLS